MHDVVCYYALCVTSLKKNRQEFISQKVYKVLRSTSLSHLIPQSVFKIIFDLDFFFIKKPIIYFDTSILHSDYADPEYSLEFVLISLYLFAKSTPKKLFQINRWTGRGFQHGF